MELITAVPSSDPKIVKSPTSPVLPGLTRSRLEAWNDSAQQYDTFEKKWHFYGTVADAMIHQLTIRKDSRVLELACGTGACTLKLAKIVQTGKIVALDFSDGMLNVAKENLAVAGASNVFFIHGNASDISQLLAGEKFDFVICNSAFWHFPDPEKVLVGLRGLLTESGEFALSLPSWINGNDKVREAFRAKAMEVLLKHGLTSEEIEKIWAKRPRQRVDLLTILNRSGFVVREISFEFKVSLESRDAWRQIAIFSGNRRKSWFLPDLDPLTQKEVREELDEWRKVNFPWDSSIPRWQIFVARPCQDSRMCEIYGKATNQVFDSESPLTYRN
jgi:ubiquinone/menaquinone biosynthesis C-methylase UbiE